MKRPLLRKADLHRLGLAAALTLGSILAGCGAKTPESDTAEVTPSKAPAEPAKPETTPTETAKDSPKG